MLVAHPAPPESKGVYLPMRADHFAPEMGASFMTGISVRICYQRAKRCGAGFRHNHIGWRSALS